MMKYIVMQGRDYQTGAIHELPIIFPKCINHDVMSQMTIRAMDRTGGDIKPTLNVVSAGFCEVSADPNCHGRSETLDLDSRGEQDDVLIRNASQWNKTAVEAKDDAL
ncbi:hypothetical protein D3C80_1095810 [compost metagenome]